MWGKRLYNNFISSPHFVILSYYPNLKTTQNIFIFSVLLIWNQYFFLNILDFKDKKQHTFLKKNKQSSNFDQKIGLRFEWILNATMNIRSFFNIFGSCYLWKHSLVCWIKLTVKKIIALFFSLRKIRFFIQEHKLIKCTFYFF